MARPRRGDNVEANAPKQRKTRRVLKEKTNTTRAKAGGRDEDNSEGLRKGTKAARGQPKKVIEDESEVIVVKPAGAALPVKAKPPRTAAKRGAKTADKEKGVRQPVQSTQRSTALEQQPTNATSSGQALARRAPGQARKPSIAPEPPLSFSILSRAEPRFAADFGRDEEDLIFSPSPSQPSLAEEDRVFAYTSSAIKAHDTAAAVDNSILALRNFKRRPRQPSMLQMVQQRRASAAPSMLGTSQAIDYQPTVDVETDDEEDVFSPEAEGTPFHIASGDPDMVSRHEGSPTRLSQTTTRIARKRRPDLADESPEALESSANKRRRVAGSGQKDQFTRLSARSQPGDRSSSVYEDAPSQIQVINSSPLEVPSRHSSSPLSEHATLDDIIVSTERRTEELAEPQEDEDPPIDIAHDATLADPASSSPAQSHTSTAQREIMADPLTQRSPSPPRRRGREKPKPRPMTTTALKSLLPKRRQPLRPRRRRTEYVLESSDGADDDQGEDDEDELTSARPRRRKPTAPSRAEPSKSKQRKTSVAVSQKSVAAVAAAKKSQRTYGRHTTSDKENNVPRGHDEDEEFAQDSDEDETEQSLLPDVSISMEEASLTAELAAAKRKFAVVDDWEMEFESMSVDGEHRSSSQLWR